jgi:hypothetical protein
MNKMEMLQEMFLSTQFEKHIGDFMKVKKKNIRLVFQYFIKYKNTKGTLIFCNSLLSVEV